MAAADRITSTKNPLVRRFRAVAEGDQADLMVAEGFRLARDALSVGLEVVEFAWSDKLLGRQQGEELLRRLRQAGSAEHPCSDGVLARISHLRSHQGVVLVLRRPVWQLCDLVASADHEPLVVVAAAVQDPGNLGALLRSAEAAGATGFLALETSADPWRDKAVRGSMGSVFRLPCVAGVTVGAAVEFLSSRELSVVVADQDAERVFWDTDLSGPTAIVLGNEGSGVPQPLSEIAAAKVHIPIAGGVESLNVAVAAGVLLFEARRQRG